MNYHDIEKLAYLCEGKFSFKKSGKTLKAFPFVEVGKIKFGMTREKVRSIMGDHTEYNKTKSSKDKTDVFENVHVFYKDGRCEAVEVHSGGLYKVKFKSVTILPGNKDDYLKLIDSEDGNLTNPDMGVSATFDGDKIKTIIFAEEGYF